MREEAAVATTSSSAAVTRTGYLEAVGTYERGLEALQRRDFAAAAELLRAVIDRYPEERELHERARLYLRVCEREMSPPDPGPQTPEELVYAATLALNAGAVSEALVHLRRAVAVNPESDHVQYMLAVACSLAGDREAAIDHLRRAVELNAQNRSLARNEPDFEALRADDRFHRILELPPGPHGRRRLRGRGASR